MAITVAARPSLSSRAGGSGRAEADAIRLRSRFLFRLGIYDPNFTNASIHHKIRDASRKRQVRPPSPQDEAKLPAPYLVPLVMNQDSPCGDDPRCPRLVHDPPSVISLSDASSASDATVQVLQVPKPRRPRRSSLVLFDPSVKVVPIPSHKSYSPGTHAKLHTPKEELVRNAARNSREFVSEGWDWRTAVEEGGMHRCRFSGELVHPVHLSGMRANPYLHLAGS